ncbi:MAG: M15 family metallopeptidase [Paludibacterium sp.]|uniref:M15 family metallopeptidase n=1 Tax=Paludibacterium sp. TaxID=1917523 RepID=UPI0025FCA5D0|nr:M15 family metallopeptidase [Paludibacterium sp.]MBV8048939.1 M15 family metallopeptidase [Paludibacterium sp.]MBV8647787.1 M15 family metallopeptidase [Paludibacterium sp.]
MAWRDVSILAMLLITTASAGQPAARRPADFISLGQSMPHVQRDMRYATDFNFVGKKIDGYDAPLCLLTRRAAGALDAVAQQLAPMGLALKVYDCYRPQRAVDHFARWAEDPGDVAMRTAFYPTVDKRRLFSDGYIAHRSGHSRGSTVDLTIVPLGSAVPPPFSALQQADCTGPAAERAPDNSLDFGTGYDCFSPVSHPDYQALSPQVKANRLLLRQLMMQAGFTPLSTEWWHFTLKDEPYPDSYFDFPVRP